MRTIDLSPLYRSFIGSDRLGNLVDKANQQATSTSYPLYNIELLDDDKYRISLAIAGFKQEEVSIELKENTLTVAGKKSQPMDDTAKRKFLHNGIAQRNFERKFQLGEHVKVLDADLVDGILDINLERVVPESKKPVSISIGSNNPS